MKNYFMVIPNSIAVNQILSEIEQINEETFEYGLKLSEQDVKAIVETRNQSLSSTGRVEFGGGIITKVISTFCDSPYILQSNYVEIINELIENFYYFKNETLEEISDDELIEFMKEYFDNKCQGDLDLLRYRYLDKVAHNVKYGVKDYLNVDDYMDGDGDEEVEEEW